MRFSIVVPVLNEEYTIKDLLRSLDRLDYPRRGMEVLIVDGGSQDRTQEIVKQFPYRLLVQSEKRKNENAARNLGIRCSHGDIIAFTDGDCVVTASWLKQMVQGFNKPKIGAVAGPVVLLPPSSFIQRFHQYLATPGHNANLQPYPFAVTANVAYRRAVFEKVGLFDERFTTSMDVDLALRMQKESGFSLRFLAGTGVVFHHSERNFLHLMSRAWKYGYGYYLLSRKHSSEFPLAPFAHALCRRWRRIPGEVRPTEGFEDFYSIIRLAIFRTIYQLCQDSGTLAARIELSRLASHQFSCSVGKPRLTTKP